MVVAFYTRHAVRIKLAVVACILAFELYRAETFTMMRYSDLIDLVGISGYATLLRVAVIIIVTR